MTLWNSFLQMLGDAPNGQTWERILSIAAWLTGSCLTSELLGYWLHRLLHSGLIGFLSRNHMKHHLALYGPLQDQRSQEYRDATERRASIGNVGMEWLFPAALLLACSFAAFQLLDVRWSYRLVYFGATFGWSFLMFSYLHDAQHIEGFWMERNRWLKRWFVSARSRHDIHHRAINDRGLMDRNFGIGFFFFDHLFGTSCTTKPAFNQAGYRKALERFRSIVQ